MQKVTNEWYSLRLERPSSSIAALVLTNTSRTVHTEATHHIILSHTFIVDTLLHSTIYC